MNEEKKLNLPQSLILLLLIIISVAICILDTPAAERSGTCYGLPVLQSSPYSL